MIIKTYIAKDMYDAMMKIKQDLGGDATIVNKREVREKGFFGLFKPKVLEVTAAVENMPRGIVKRTDNYEPLNSTNGRANEEVKRAVAQIDVKNDEIKGEISELREIVEMLVKKTDDSHAKENLATVKAIMNEMDLHLAVTNDFEFYCKEKNLFSEDINKDILNEFVFDRVSKKIKINEPKGRIRTFIGPTGVGKTTTIAKLASREALLNQKNVGLITIDTYRIGAVEQLKIYANILDIPLKVVFAPEDLPKAIGEFDDKDLIFIDSTGRSNKNMHQINEMKTYFDQYPDMEIFLVLSMVTKNVDLGKTIENYKKMCFDSIILTKFDETYSFGNILNLTYFTEKPVSYVSKGQVVPDDIEMPTKEMLTKQIWGDAK